MVGAYPLEGFPVKSNLATHVRYLLINRPKTVSLKKVSEDTQLSLGFITNLIAMRNKEYTANKLERLYEYFTGKELTP
jgi:hypothetical protein